MDIATSKTVRSFESDPQASPIVRSNEFSDQILDTGVKSRQSHLVFSRDLSEVAIRCPGCFNGPGRKAWRRRSFDKTPGVLPKRGQSSSGLIKAVAKYLHRYSQEAQFGKRACPEIFTSHLPRPRVERHVMGRISMFPCDQCIDVQKVSHGKSASAARISDSDTALSNVDALNGNPDTGWFLRTIFTGLIAPSPSAAFRRYAETVDFDARALARIWLADWLSTLKLSTGMVLN